MKWLVIQSDGQHKGQDGWEPNWMMRECYAIKAALTLFGDRADVWGLRHDNYDQTPDFHNYDGIFTCENYELGWLPRVNGLYRALRIFWIIDAHWQPLGAYAEAIKGYDIILHSTRGFIEPYQKLYPGPKHVYFPNGVDDRFFDQTLYPNRPHGKPLIFIGGKAAPRAAAIDHMVANAGMEYSYGVTGLKYVEAVLDAKIQFNKGLNGDINYRNWETIGLGTCLLTEYDPEMEALGFQHDVNCLFYRTLDEAVDLVKLYTSSGEWERVARGGYLLSKQHTYTQRVETLIHHLFNSDLCQPNKLWNLHTPASATTSPQLVTR
jgi:hypothetical protein